MIKVELNNKTKKIPNWNELNVTQLVRLFKHKDINIISYLSAVFNKSFKDTAETKIKGYEKLMLRIGKYEQYEKIIPSKKFIFGDEVININQLEISKVGQRYMIELHAGKMSNEEYLCFILAIAMTEDFMNSSEVNKIKRKLMKMPYKIILPNAFFLASRFLIGKRSVTNYLKVLAYRINIKLKVNRQILKDWLITLMTMRFKPYVSYST